MGTRMMGITQIQVARWECFTNSKRHLRHPCHPRPYPRYPILIKQDSPINNGAIPM